MRLLRLLTLFLLLPGLATAQTAWWNSAPGGAASTVNDANRLIIEQNGVGRTITRGLLLQGYSVSGHGHDHGALTGLADDDHPHYYNQTRGDARYSLLTHEHSLSDLTDPQANKSFSFGNKTLHWLFTNPDGGMHWEITGAATGHHLEVLQTGGNPGSDLHLMHLEATDADPLMLHLVPGSATSRAIKANAPGESMGPGRFNLDASGKMTWGDGTNAIDATLARISAGLMRLTGDFDVQGTFTVNGLPVSGSGAVDSVNSQTGAVVLDADDIAETPTRVYVSPTQKAAIDTALQSESDTAALNALSVHEVAHPAPTERDIRNEAADATIIKESELAALETDPTVPVNLKNVPPSDGKRYIFKNGNWVEYDIYERVAAELAETPRRLYEIFGPSNSGNCVPGVDTPNSSDGTLTDLNLYTVAAIAAGGSADNVRWRCDEGLPSSYAIATATGYVYPFAPPTDLTKIGPLGGAIDTSTGYIYPFSPATDISFVPPAGLGTIDTATAYVSPFAPATTVVFRGGVMDTATASVYPFAPATDLTDSTPVGGNPFEGFTLAGGATVDSGVLTVTDSDDIAYLQIDQNSRGFFVQYDVAWTDPFQNANVVGYVAQVGTVFGIAGESTNAWEGVNTYRWTHFDDEETFEWITPVWEKLSSATGGATVDASVSNNQGTIRIEFAANGTTTWKVNGTPIATNSTGTKSTFKYVIFRGDNARGGGSPNQPVSISNYSTGAL